MSLAKPDAVDISNKQKIALAIGIIGLFENADFTFVNGGEKIAW